jgi:hypothetical protein
MRHLITMLGGRRGVLALVAAVVGLGMIGFAVHAQQTAPQPQRAGRIAVSPGPAAAGASFSAQPSPAQPAPPRARPLGPSQPVHISIPAIDVSSRVFPLGKNPDGTLAVPQPGPRLNTVGWYKNSPTPGQPGPSILLGHVDSVQGPSVFFRLGDVHPGDQVIVRRRDHVTLVFTVNAVRDFKKAHFPSRLVYGGDDLSTPQLRLITCSDFVESIHHHIGNEVVFAHLSKVRSPHAG